MWFFKKNHLIVFSPFGHCKLNFLALLQEHSIILVLIWCSLNAEQIYHRRWFLKVKLKPCMYLLVTFFVWIWEYSKPFPLFAFGAVFSVHYQIKNPLITCYWWFEAGLITTDNFVVSRVCLKILLVKFSFSLVFTFMCERRASKEQVSVRRFQPFLHVDARFFWN